ncbi:glycerophosphodiester phosphodiesterase [Ktedonobacter robiniae]|uniref:Glycerophosphoryl diester phosphodiesterase n=1 Tax=Ktedonobacter robiniae TaxID=2778365 RepID=A0ABQ3UIA9_9CHLR|nr:glycerophosphodiester phosphodiesterase [Ktedonobacter robiniae]GHO52150.1 glycerophosphoryl diester phosphodiesterase [Ktedonobacter robiniae]
MQIAGRMACVAHRGGARLAPENTLRAFRNALALEVDAVELDVQMSRDGQLVVFHDNTLERLTEGHGNLLDQDFAYLRSLNAAAHFPSGWSEHEQIPTLREVLELVKGRAHVLLELKSSQRDGAYGRYPRMVPAVLEDLQVMEMLDQVLLIAFDWELLAEAKQRQPEVETGLILSSEVWDVQAEGWVAAACMRARELGSAWIDIDHHLLTPGVAQIIRQEGLHLAAWTANTPEDIQHCQEVGVEALATDRPDLMLRSSMHV